MHFLAIKTCYFYATIRKPYCKTDWVKAKLLTWWICTFTLLPGNRNYRWRLYNQYYYNKQLIIINGKHLKLFFQSTIKYWIRRYINQLDSRLYTSIEIINLHWFFYNTTFLCSRHFYCDILTGYRIKQFVRVQISLQQTKFCLRKLWERYAYKNLNLVVRLYP